MDFPRNEYIALRAFLPLLYTEEGTNEAVTAWLQNATGRKTLRNSLRTLLVTVEASFPDSFPLPCGEGEPIRTLDGTSHKPHHRSPAHSRSI